MLGGCDFMNIGADNYLAAQVLNSHLLAGLSTYLLRTNCG